MSKAPTLRQFQAQFPTEESCLDHLMRIRFGERHDCAKCGKNARYYRVSTRKVYSCEHCGHQIAPMAGTPFERTRTPLRDWFFVMFLFTTSRNGVAAKEVERQLGVTYKTAWRMCHEIRKYMGTVDGDNPLGGLGRTVQIDETFIGGKHRRVSHGGISTLGYRHEAVNHRALEYVCAKTGATTNALEGFWAQLKRGINGTHIHVSAKHLPKYLGEFEFRHNRRDRPTTMLAELMVSFAR